jgi:hypothetical protein
MSRTSTEPSPVVLAGHRKSDIAGVVDATPSDRISAQYPSTAATRLAIRFATLSAACRRRAHLAEGPRPLPCAQAPRPAIAIASSRTHRRTPCAQRKLFPRGSASGSWPCVGDSPSLESRFRQLPQRSPHTSMHFGRLGPASTCRTFHTGVARARDRCSSHRRAGYGRTSWQQIPSYRWSIAHSQPGPACRPPDKDTRPPAWNQATAMHLIASRSKPGVLGQGRLAGE